MFLALDDSYKHPKKVFGAVLLPKQEVSELEKDWTELRFQHKLFGEIKWDSIDKNYKKYFDFLNLFFNQKKATFHSICFQNPSQRYKSAYLLIRAITWKMRNARIYEPIFVLFDNFGNIGKMEVEKIKEFAKKDREFKLDIEFCNQGASHLLAPLQIADVITGATASKINNISLREEKIATIKYIESKNNGIPLGWSGNRFPRLYEYKIHHFNPLSGK